MNLLLISKTAIIKQIFNLVAKKLDLTLTILDVDIVSKEFDIIIVEDTLLDQNFPTHTYTKRFGIITKDQSLNQGDFTIPKPFLPSTLSTILQEQINILLTKDLPKDVSCEVYPHQEEKETLDYIETLADDISDEILEESDESIVPTAFVEGGGVLDSSQLNEIQDILDDKDTNKNDNSVLNSSQENTTDTTNVEDDEWVDLADIIDKAIGEVKDYNFNIDEPIKLILNEYSMQELSPLLNKLDQNIIDTLTNGKEITLKLKVETK